MMGGVFPVESSIKRRILSILDLFLPAEVLPEMIMKLVVLLALVTISVHAGVLNKKEAEAMQQG